MKPAPTGSLLIVALALGGMTHRLIWQGRYGARTETKLHAPGRLTPGSSPPLHSGRMPVTAATVELRSPEDMAKWLRTLPQQECAESLSIACQRMSNRDPAAAASLLVMFPDMVDEGIASKVLQEWGWRDPSAAALWIQEGPLPAAITEKCLAEVMDAWRGVDRGAANRFIAALPGSEMHGRLLLDASRLLTDGSLDSACEFVRGLPERAQRVGACRRILDAEFRPPAHREWAMKWIGEMTDSGVRNEMLAAAQKCWPEPPPVERSAADDKSPPVTGGDGDPFAQ